MLPSLYEAVWYTDDQSGHPKTARVLALRRGRRRVDIAVLIWNSDEVLYLDDVPVWDGASTRPTMNYVEVIPVAVPK